jgi:tRNA threonylcarbamoyladenosine biosynthesis protein TsaE
MDVTVKTIEETRKLACKIASKIKSGDVIALYGDLGAGKTTFTRFLCECLNVKSRVQSPTFVIARKYESNDVVVNHLDLYRLRTELELADLDLQQFFKNEKSITVIEWPEIAENLLPKDCIKIKFEYVDETTRKINVQNIH